VEFALVLPLLILILFGAIDLGRVFHAAITITNAAREGARYIALHHDEIAAGKNQAVLEAQGAGITITVGDVSVNCPQTVLGECDRMQPVEVTVSYTFELIFSTVLPSATIDLQRTAEMLVQ
jgi:Flp pilus assembly protein TadG